MLEKYRLIEKNDRDENDSEEDEAAAAKIEKNEIIQLNEKLKKKDLKKCEKHLLENEFSFKLFKKNNCEHSLFLFSQKNALRVKLMMIFTHKYFEKFILIIIFMITIRLIVDTFIGDTKTSIVVFACLDILFSFLFLSEFIIKIISLGFVLDEGSYLWDHWNKMDLIVLVIQLIELQVIQIKLEGQHNDYPEFFKILRLLRILRPLRFISQNEEMKTIITCILDSVMLIFNVFIILILAIYIFSLSAILLFYDMYKTCVVPGTSFTSLYPYQLVQNFTQIAINLNDTDQMKLVNNNINVVLTTESY